MKRDDAAHWNARYGDRSAPIPDRAAALLLEHVHQLPRAGLAVDIAMGLGANARALMAHGLRVVGVDISHVAARTAHASSPGLMAVVADFEHFDLPPASVDVIVNFRYTQRSLWPRYRSWLRPGGWLVVESFNAAANALRPGADPRYYLQAGELAAAFSDWQIVRAYDAAPNRLNSAGIVAVASPGLSG